MELIFPFRNVAINDLLRFVDAYKILEFIDVQKKKDPNVARYFNPYLEMYDSGLANFENELIQVINTTDQATIDSYFNSLAQDIHYIKQKISKESITEIINKFNAESLARFDNEIEEKTEEYFKSDQRNLKHLEEYETPNYFFTLYNGYESKQINHNFYCADQVLKYIEPEYTTEISDFISGLAEKFFVITSKFGIQWAEGKIQDSNTMYQSKRIFISYSHNDKSVALNIEADMEIFHIADIIRDERHLKFSENLESFMKTIRITDYVMIIISDSFLKSPNCMHEIIELFKDEGFKKRILPIVVNTGENAAKIYIDSDIINYVIYWQRQTEKLNKSLSKIKIESMGDLHRRLKMFNTITHTIAEFCELLRKTKHTHPEKLKNEDYKELLEKLTSIEVNPKDLPKARNFYGLAIGEFDLTKRIAFLDRALEYNPNYLEALKERGTTLDSAGKFELALKDQTRAIQLAPKDHIHYINRGITFKNLKQFDKALDDFDYSIVLYPDDAMAYNNIADVYRRIGNLDKATKNINIALKLEPDLAWIWSTISEISAAKLDNKGFFTNMERAVELGFPLFKFLYDDVYDPYVSDRKFLTLVELSKKNDRMI